MYALEEMLCNLNLFATKPCRYGIKPLFRQQFCLNTTHKPAHTEHILQPDSGVWTIYPQAWHKVEPLDDDFAVQLEFHCEKADFFHKKYGMTATHSAIREAVQAVPPCKTLDLAVDRNEMRCF